MLKVFVELYEQGLIYRDNYMVNWDPGLGSAISDLEVEEREVTDTLYSIAYPLADGNGEVVVATVRPETMLADVAVAVHPDDERYAALVGRTVMLPLVGRELPIIADDYVKTDFGTGALKITPGHDPNDFEIGRRHGLERAQRHRRGRAMTAPPARLRGADASARRASAVVAALERAGAAPRARGAYVHTVPFCQRSGERIEPLISLQWFMRMDELAAPAIDAVRDGRVGSTRVAVAPLRRLAGEHPPVVHLAPAVVGPPDPRLVPRRARPTCGVDARPRARAGSATPTCSTRGSRSALWPFATLGWPEQTARAARLLPDRRALDRARHPVPVGRADGDDGPASSPATSRSPTSTSTRSSRRPTAAG